jgi:hypothetical protein
MQVHSWVGQAAAGNPAAAAAAAVPHLLFV